MSDEWEDAYNRVTNLENLLDIGHAFSASALAIYDDGSDRIDNAVTKFCADLRRILAVVNDHAPQE